VPETKLNGRPFYISGWKIWHCRRFGRAKMNAEIEKKNRIRRRAVDGIKLHASNARYWAKIEPLPVNLRATQKRQHLC